MTEGLVKCDACSGPFAAGEKPFTLDRKDTNATVEVHELCYLRVAVKSARVEQAQIRALLAGVIQALGGTVRIHARDMVTGCAAGPMTTTPEGGGFVTVTLGQHQRIQVVPAIVVPLRPNGKS
jgi:hypothetical protein